MRRTSAFHERIVRDWRRAPMFPPIPLWALVLLSALAIRSSLDPILMKCSSARRYATPFPSYPEVTRLSLAESSCTATMHRCFVDFSRAATYSTLFPDSCITLRRHRWAMVLGQPRENARTAHSQSLGQHVRVAQQPALAHCCSTSRELAPA